MSLASNIIEIQAPASAITGELIRPYCTVALAEGSPAEAVALGWYDDEHGELIEFDGLTILGPNHYSEVLRPEARPMSSQSTTFTVALFEPTSDDEFYETGYSWKRTNKVMSFTVVNDSGDDGGDEDGDDGGDEEEDTGGSNRWWLIGAVAGLGAALLAGGLYILKKK